MNRELRKAVLCIFLLSAPLYAFTYQGRLYDDGDPAQGSYNMYFTLYDAATSGNAVTSTYSIPGVTVVNGYFTVNISFPTAESNYNGQARWLDVTMRKSGTTDPLSPLSPRYALSSVPYAEQAQTAQRVEPLSFITDHIVKMEIDEEPDRYFHYFDVFEQRVSVYTNGTSKLPGQIQTGDIELRCFADQDTFFSNWMVSCQTTFEPKTIRLSVLDRKGIIRDQWQYGYCWPKRVQYDYDPALATVVKTVVLGAEIVASRPEGRIGLFANEWYPGPQPVVKGPFVIAPAGMSEQSFDSFNSIGLESTPVYEPVYHFITGLAISTLDPVFTRNALNDRDMANWFQDVLEGQMEQKTVRFTFDSEGRAVIGGRMQLCWPCGVKSFFDPVSMKTKESIQIVVQNLVLE